MHEGDSSITTLVSAKMNDEGTKVSVDATKMLSDVNCSGPTAHIIATNVTVNMAMKKQSSLVDTTGLGSYPPLPKHVSTSVGNAPSKSSYANVTGKPSGKKLNFHTLFTQGGNGIDVVVPVESIRTISERFANTAYGFFLGKQVAYLVVANYVRNTWGKYRLIHSMFSSSTRLFSFQFSSMDGLDAMLENVWVKLHGVPVTAFSEDGLSGIATKLGTPLMLDCYTTDMCMQSWGRSSYVRAMIELRADVELKDNIMAAMPKLTREGYYTCTNGGISNSADKGTINVSSSKTLIGIVDSDSKVELVFDETRDSYPDNDDYDPYDDDMYENHDMSEHLQSIYDDLDITVHGKKKK
ncbi:hypothetical protein Tco_0918619 [Tanacetum coccineum]